MREAIRRNRGTFPSVVVVVRRQVVGKKIGERRVGYNGARESGLVLSRQRGAGVEIL